MIFADQCRSWVEQRFQRCVYDAGALRGMIHFANHSAWDIFRGEKRGHLCLP